MSGDGLGWVGVGTVGGQERNKFTFFTAYHHIPICWSGLQLSGPIPNGLPRDGPRGQITHVPGRGQNRLFREAGRGGAGKRRGGDGLASAKAPRASDPHTGLSLR